MGTNCEVYVCLLLKGECSDAMRAEQDIYRKLPTIAFTPLPEFWIGARVCLRPCPCYMPLPAMSWQCLPLHVM